MSFFADKKREYETIAEKAIVEKDFYKAFFYTAKAAEFGLILAEQSEGKIALRYVEDAFELLDIAETLKEKASTQITEKPKRFQLENGSIESNDKVPWLLREKPTEKLDDVAGLDEVKTELKEKVVYPFMHPELFDRFKLKAGGGILMYGPPGNGKTFIARAIAGEMDAAFYNVNASQIKDKYVGETEKNLQKLFDDARKEPKVVIFLDEVDHLLAKRGNRKIGTVAQFLALADGIEKNTNCMLLLAATNKPWMIDEAVIRPGRLGTHIYVGPPDENARKSILQYNLKGVPLDQGFSFDDIAAATQDYSGADITELCEKAKRIAMNRQLASGNSEVVTQDDFSEALKKIRPSITKEMIQQFEDWKANKTVPGGEEQPED